MGFDFSANSHYGLDEDGNRSPACIADSVGVSVEDSAGMGADLFGFVAEPSCAAFVQAASPPELKGRGCAHVYPVIISCGGIVVGLVTLTVQTAAY